MYTCVLLYVDVYYTQDHTYRQRDAAPDVAYPPKGLRRVLDVYRGTRSVHIREIQAFLNSRGTYRPSRALDEALKSA